MTSPAFHWSDCSLHNPPALPAGPCDCGGLSSLTDDCPHGRIAAFVSGAGRISILVDHMGREGFIEPHQLPPGALATVAAAAHLPDAHESVTILGMPNGMDLNDARKAVIAEFKTLTGPQSIASLSGPHEQPPVAAVQSDSEVRQESTA